MSARSAILVLLSGFYFWLCDYVYTCRIKQVCYGCQTEAVAAGITPAIMAGITPVEAPPALSEPLMFKWSDPNPLRSEHFETFRASIAGRMKGDDVLEITGLYFKEELNDSGYSDLGLARAHQIKQLFIPLIPEKRIMLKSKLISEKPGVRRNSFESADFYWIPVKQKNE